MSVLRVELRVSEERESGELKTERESAGVLSFFRGRVQLQSVWCDANVEKHTQREAESGRGGGVRRELWFATYSAAGCCSMAEYCAPDALPSRRDSSQH